MRELEAPLLAVLAELMYLLGELPKAQDALFELIPRCSRAATRALP